MRTASGQNNLCYTKQVCSDSEGFESSSVCRDGVCVMSTSVFCSGFEVVLFWKHWQMIHQYEVSTTAPTLLIRL